MRPFMLAMEMDVGDADIVAQAIGDVLLADVICHETKARLVDCLTVLKAGLNCPESGCGGCYQRRTCERLIDDVLSTT